ncbi:nuclease [Entomophthora muscae]|uniref:Nuclease n=1 Tax=Entomophthora muscae TaxID=34485 RepID=A0ACC2RNI7_9FUNG|nr:nuclease [Entomophthora muscae]
MFRKSMVEKMGLMLGGAGIGILTYSLYGRTFIPKTPSTIYPVPNSQAPISSMPSPNAELLKYGFPGPISDFRNRQGYVASHNRMLRNPNFVLELLTKDKLINRDNASRDHSKFMEDKGVPELFRAKLSDYRRSGYDRGHMAPAADFKSSQEAMDETFYLTNMAPQVGQGFNRDYWAWLEDYCRKLTTKFSEVYVLTGPLYLPTKGPQFPDPDKWYVQYEVIGNPPNIAVPTHFFKVILAIPHDSSKPSLAGFLLPNRVIPDNVPLTQFQVPIETIEKAAGAVFFDRLGPNKEKELANLCSTVPCQLHIKKFNEQGKLLTK